MHLSKHRIYIIAVSVMVCLMILAIIFLIISKRNSQTLESYTGGETVTRDNYYVETTEAETEALQYFYDNEYNYTFAVPNDWDYVENGVDVYYIHRASGASVKTSVNSYYPSINNISSESASLNVVNNGMAFVDFTKYDNSHFEVRYQDVSEDTTFDYIIETYWDRDTVITLECVFRDEYYSDLISIYDSIISSFYWERPNPIPEGYYLYYVEKYNCEVAIPDNWDANMLENTIYATDTVYGLTASFSAVQNSTPLSSLTSTDIYNLVSSGKQNVMVNSFDVTDSVARCNYSFINTGTAEKTYGYTYIFSNGTWLFLLDYTQPSTYGFDFPHVCSTLFRMFE